MQRRTVGVEHLCDEAHLWRLVRVLLRKLQRQLEYTLRTSVARGSCETAAAAREQTQNPHAHTHTQPKRTVFKGRVGGAKNHRIPQHDVVVRGRSHNPAGRVVLQPVPHDRASTTPRSPPCLSPSAQPPTPTEQNHTPRARDRKQGAHPLKSFMSRRRAAEVMFAVLVEGLSGKLTHSLTTPHPPETNPAHHPYARGKGFSLTHARTHMHTHTHTHTQAARCQAVSAVRHRWTLRGAVPTAAPSACVPPPPPAALQLITALQWLLLIHHTARSHRVRGRRRMRSSSSITTTPAMPRPSPASACARPSSAPPWTTTPR
jgi:hypothetical protein